MRGMRRAVRALAAMLFAVGAATPSLAATIRVAAGDDALQSAIDAAAEGDVLVLEPGEHRGPVVLRRGLTLAGDPGAVLRGDGRGSVVRVEAPAAAVRGLVITGSGRDAERMDAGVFLAQGAVGAVVEGNEIRGNLSGVYVHGAPRALVRNNLIEGMRTARVNESGNGVTVWNAPGAKVIANRISEGRDGIFTISSRGNEFSGNRFERVRFAIHYMYTNDSVVSGNVSTGNTVGFALMFSHRIEVRDNLSDGDRDHGLLLNYANVSRITGNVVRGRLQPASRWAAPGQRGEEAAHGLPAEASASTTGAAMRAGPEKCVFIYNANQNRFASNWFEGCEIGIHFTAGSERNEIVGNAFVRNRTQVKYVGTRHLDWSRDGRGNYWSDNPAFDLTGDGIADAAYRPNDLVDKALWTAPQAKLLLASPAVQVLRWAQSQFPALLPGGVVDSHPLIDPPPRPAALAGAP